MNLEHLFLEIETDLSNYKSKGLIDRTSLRRWFFLAVKKFGQTVTTKTRTVVEIKGGKGCLPEDFQSIIKAFKCTPITYTYAEEDTKILQNSVMWKEKVERNSTWNSCTPCCKEVCEKTIVENTYIDSIPVSFHYSNPEKLRISKRTKRDYCSTECTQFFDSTSLNEIEIDSTTVYTNWGDGALFIEYYGLERDEDNQPLVPDSPRGKVQEYIEYHLKKKLFEKWALNSDDENTVNKLNLLIQAEKQSFEEAIRDAKMNSLTPDSYAKLAQKNRIKTSKIEYLLPQ